MHSLHVIPFRPAEVIARGRGHFRMRPPAQFYGQILEVREDARPHFVIVALTVGGVDQIRSPKDSPPSRIPAAMFAGADPATDGEPVTLELDQCSPQQEIEIVVENTTDAPHVFGASLRGLLAGDA